MRKRPIEASAPGRPLRTRPVGPLSDPVDILGLGKRLRARARIARGVCLSRALEDRIAVGDRLMFRPLDRAWRWLVMKLGAD